MPAPAQRSTAQDRFLDSLLDRLNIWLSRSPLVTRVGKASITSVAAGGAPDGVSALVVINWLGTDVAVPYVSSYTPAAGHVVAVARTGSQLLILGRIVGTP